MTITATFRHRRILGAKKKISDCRNKDCNDCYVRHRLFGVNLRAPMILAKLLLPAMIEKGEGVVINIGSVSGKTGEANGAAYSASKFGLIGFTQSLYEEVREEGIKVSVILPGFVDTPLIPPNRQLDRSKMIQADDIAQAVNYVLTSPATCCPVEITVRPQRTPYR